MVCYAHSLGEIVTAAATAGLRIDELTEHLQCSFEHRNGIPLREDDGWWRLRADGIPLPLLFTLRATRPPSAVAARPRSGGGQRPRQEVPGQLPRPRRRLWLVEHRVVPVVERVTPVGLDRDLPARTRLGGVGDPL